MWHFAAVVLTQGERWGSQCAKSLGWKEAAGPIPEPELHSVQSSYSKGSFITLLFGSQGWHRVTPIGFPREPAALTQIATAEMVSHTFQRDKRQRVQWCFRKTSPPPTLQKSITTSELRTLEKRQCRVFMQAVLSRGRGAYSVALPLPGTASVILSQLGTQSVFWY